MVILSYSSVGLQQWGDVFLEGLSSLVQRQMLGGTQGSFGPLKLQTSKDSLCFHGCWNCFFFIHFWKIPFGSCMGAEAFENLVFRLRCYALLKGKLAFHCFAFIFIQNRSVEKILSQQSWLKTYQRYRLDIHMPKKGQLGWCFVSWGVIQKVSTRRLCQSPFAQLFWFRSALQMSSKAREGSWLFLLSAQSTRQGYRFF